MHPEVVSDEPGACPICGMDLNRRTASAGDHATAVTVDSVVVQTIGVRTARAERGPIARQVRTLGSVEVAEDQLSVVNLRYSGWVERIYVDETGTRVRRGQPLFDIYSPELVSAQEEYVTATRNAGPASPLAKSARTRLELWGMSPRQIERALATGATRTIAVVAPATGYVLAKSVVQGARVQAGTDLYRIGNLATIWIKADVYEMDAPWMKVGARATMELSFQQGRTYDGAVAYVYPTLDTDTRTLRVRLEFKNPDLLLKPGMFATVRIETEPREALRIPSEAIIRSGNRQIVFTVAGPGRYEPREVTTGLTGEGRLTEVLGGVAEGEEVVTSGQFLLDSESQLHEAVQKMVGQRRQAQSGHAAETGGEGRWTCGMHPQIAEDSPGRCPLCGMDLVERNR
jgi:Cu(I)/Ag(I) efflux system membrane fusion protein/cobalt-zinc-cadmium efflux system membrane fusion protein